MKKLREIKDYDEIDTTSLIDPKRQLTLENLGFKLPATPPSQVVSIRLPTRLLNQIRSKASAMDIPYQAFIKMALNRVVRHS
ncbi:MAG: hypothetical protein HYY44_07265 [Deltaproteobacteria bacterium]|nr:hypothetical protein [Deltaproteobacteria bacterium]MBI4374411.1 hypothetical protein [Deltaproteobacteria bacterium]